MLHHPPALGLPHRQIWWFLPYGTEIKQVIFKEQIVLRNWLSICIEAWLLVHSVEGNVSFSTCHDTVTTDMTRKLAFYRWVHSIGVLWNSFPSGPSHAVRFDQRKQTWAIRWCCSLMTLETAICMLSNIATTSRILSSNDGAANIWKEKLHYISPDEVKV